MRRVCWDLAIHCDVSLVVWFVYAKMPSRRLPGDLNAIIFSPSTAYVHGFDLWKTP